MLNDFFKLDVPFQTFKKPTDPSKHFQTSSQLENVLYEPSFWQTPPHKLSGKVFKNVSLSKTTFSRLTFQNCTFEDCLIIGCTFEEVEFHQCKFTNCNFYKSEFERCYIDPDCISFDKSLKDAYSNVGVGLFQQLLDNSSDQHQADHAASADISFRRWQRSQYRHDLKKGKITKPQYFGIYFRNLAFDNLAGYGYRPLKFFIWTIALFMVIAILNYWLLGDHFSVDGSDGTKLAFVDSIYYTFSIMTVLGFSSVAPVTPTAKLLTVLQTLAAIGWLGIFTSVLVKRFIR